MFTEDDDKVTINKGRKDDSSNFYTSFIKNEKLKKKKEDKKGKKGKKEEPKEDYSNYYSTFLENEKQRKEQTEKEKNSAGEVNYRRNLQSVDKDHQEMDFYYSEDNYSEVYQDDDEPNNKKNLRKMIIFGIEIIAVIILLLLVIFKTNLFGNQPGITLKEKNTTISVGDDYQIAYDVVNTDKNVSIKFDSMNQNIAAVDNNGIVTGIISGETDIVVSYTIDGKTKEKKFHVQVVGEGNYDKNISLSVNIENATENVWTNHDVSLKVNAKSVYGISNVEYATNCEGSNCKYSSVKNNKITINKNGTNKVIVRVKDKNNKVASKTLTIMIDKEKPTITFNEGNSISGTNSVNVCATCKDSVSGCKKDKVCTKYTSSKQNQTITIEDNAGNKVSTHSFDVEVKHSGSSSKKCSLSVSSSGKITATVPSGAKYYGFNSNYSGTNTKTQNVTINISKAGESRAKIINYYVKTSSGSKITCSLTVIKQCKCSSGSGSNCPVSCTFRAG